MNRLGKCVSYPVTQGLLTELAFTSAKKSKDFPENLHKRSDLNLMVAFDNFDLFVSTPNGKDTMHETVEIGIQTIPASLEEQEIDQPLFEDEFEEPSTTAIRKRRRRAFEAKDDEIAPYPKKVTMSTTLLDLEDERRKVNAATIESAALMDFWWLTCLFSEIPQTPMWVGWNSQRILSPQPKQKVVYLPQIDASPTRNDVVVETLERSKRMKEACNQKYMSVTYDLAIAMPALKIQKAEGRKYQDLFIQLGTFHMVMSYFKGVGKFMAESGLPHILTESGVLAQGSLRGFLNGTNFNRNKRIHPLLAAALLKLHFKSFLKQEHTMDAENLKQLLLTIKIEPGDESTVTKSLPSEIQELYEKYNSYRKLTLKGEHSATAQFCMIYVEMIDVYHHLSRAVRTGNLELYTHALTEMNKLYHLFGHQNYARWGVK